MSAPFFAEFFAFVKRVHERGRRPLVIVDLEVARLYANLLSKSKLPWIVIARGERAKCREEKMRVENYLLDHGYGRDSELIGFGGGATLDLVGFIAATYMRGVFLSFIPTTVIGYVDASVGGKNGINTRHGKNLLGTFYEPGDSCLTTAFLDTLPKELFDDQYAEVVKMACLCGKDLLKGEVFTKARAAKAAVVKRDQREKGERAILNLGHTFAHAYEKIFAYQVSHGRAVWVGLRFIALLSYRLKLLSKKDLQWIESFCNQTILPFDKNELYQAMAADKKNKKGAPHFVLLKGVGSPYERDGVFAHPVDKELVLEVLSIIGKEKKCIVS
ncbi:3-dehydroquinate synthase [bacterium]|nr:3-dehydroquinate synthase [bacterium]